MAEPIKVLIVDDSAFNRRNVAGALANHSDIRLVGTAADGEEALRLVSILKPTVITLDLEMPKMDGFTFLRILMSKFPTPVIVFSSYSQRENIFRALELGAFDFISKPDRYLDSEVADVKDTLLSKVVAAHWARHRVQPRPSYESGGNLFAEFRPVEVSRQPPRYLVAVASSTGGPTALMDIFGRLPEKRSLSVLVAQHMPEKFTRTFAERLDRRSHLRVAEAQDGDVVGERMGYVCPGGRCMQLETGTLKSSFKLRVRAPEAGDRYVPSADRLLSSAAQVAGPRCIGLILTGMGDDGVQGARAIQEAGGQVIAESEDTAVVYGMPGAAVRAGVVDHVLPLPEIVEWLCQLGS